MFTGWLAVQSGQVRQSILTSCRGAGIDLVILNGELELAGWIDDHQLTVIAEHEGKFWDILISLDVSIEPMDAGYECRECPVGERRVFPTVDALVIDHLFDPLREWIEEKLIPAVGLAFFENGGATWAKLIDNLDGGAGAAHLKTA